MKKKRGVTLAGFMIAILVIGMFVALLSSILRAKMARADAAMNTAIKKTYYAGVDPNEAEYACCEAILGQFEQYLKSKSPSTPLHAATAGDEERFLEERKKALQRDYPDIGEAAIEKMLENRRNALDKWLKTAEDVKKKEGWR